ncbi:MAG: HD domain-containing protein, partial [Deltaproteobacteria bacterium]|nr:HD domain-containing protein [Deltaproteobacteria bacterium]
MSKDKDGLAAILQQFAAALQNAALYPVGHPSLNAPLSELLQGVNEILEERERVAIGLIDDVLIIDEMPFYEANKNFSAIFDALEDQALEAITFTPGVTLEELQHLITILTGLGAFALEAVRKTARTEKFSHIAFREAIEGDEDPRAKAQRTYEESLTVMIDLMTEVRLGQIPATRHASAIIDNMRDIILTDGNGLLGLTQLKAYDYYTYQHSINVAIFSLAFAHANGLPPDMVQKVGLAGLLHDLGKVRVAEDVIKKPGALTEDEIKLMQRHPELGAEIIAEMPGIDGDTHDIVLHHHLRFDGGGYPQLPPDA